MNPIRFAFIALMLTLAVNASEEIPTQEEVAKLYVATFNRAPDAAGLAYWTNSSGLTLSGIAQSFFDQPETLTLYPVQTTNASFITSVYENLFNRQPDTAGLNYWENELNTGVFTKNRFIEAVIAGALNSDLSQDANILINKMIVGLSFADAGLENPDDARTIMLNITEDSVTLTSAVTSFGIALYEYIPSDEKIILFTMASGGVNTDTIYFTDSSTTLSSSTSYLFKYDLSANILGLVSSNTSQSYASSTLKPLTKNGTFYTIVNLSGDTIRGYDPVTLEADSTNKNISTKDGMNKYAIVDEQVFYISYYSNDLRATGLDSYSESEVILDENSPYLPNYLHGVGSNLLSIKMSTIDNQQYFIINKHSTITGIIEEELSRVNTDDFIYKFFDGNEALYWYIHDTSNQLLNIFQLKPDGSSPKHIFQTEIVNSAYNLTVDDSNGKVFITYSDNDTPYFYMVDSQTCKTRILDIEPSLFSSIYKGMQFSYIPPVYTSSSDENFCPN